MICLFNSLETTTNEEFRKVLEQKIRVFTIVIITGTITAGIALVNEFFHFISASSWLSGLYTGMGTGLIAVGVLKIIRYKKILKEENLIKEERLKSQDERNKLIAAKALQAAAFTVLLLAYITMLITAFYSKAIFYCFWGVIMIFTVTYAAYLKYYSTKL